MTTSTKSVNWSAETVAVLTENYPAMTVEALAQKLGKSVPAVRSKLVSLKVYQKQEPRAVGGASSVRKIQLVKQLAEALQVEMEKVESLEKASKEALQLLLECLTAE
jgi:hypothetical protein